MAAKKESAQPSAAVVAELVTVGEHHELTLGERRYRVGGLEKNGGLDSLKITLRLWKSEEGNRSAAFHLDQLDLCKDAERRRFCERGAHECRLDAELIKRDLGRLLLACERAQDARLRAALAPGAAPAVTIPADERKEAEELLRAPDLIKQLDAAFDAAGIVGEKTNRLAAYLTATSRLLDRPLAVIIQSTSAAGKSTLMEAVLSFFPPEEQVKYSAMTGQSLYYLGEKNLEHKILAIVEEEGAEKASYALKLLQSEGELTIASTGKDAHTGRMKTEEYRVQGPVSIILTTTSVDIDEERMNRCLILSVDESREQTARIHALQRQARTLEGLRMKRKRRQVRALLQNAQRLLKPLEVVMGKGKKDRVLPVGARALHWCERYLEEVRPRLEIDHGVRTLFLTGYGAGFHPNALGYLIAKYLRGGGVEKGGAHIIRHTCAQHLLEGGADIRYIQKLLGHASLETTAIYTEMSVEALRRVYSACHPAETRWREKGR